MIEEIWKEIPNFPDYEVSNLGRVKSLKFGKERILRAGMDRQGSFQVGLSNKDGRKTFRIHSLIGIVFPSFEGEEWKTIAIAPNYQISNFGRIKSFCNMKERIRHPHRRESGEQGIDLWKNGGYKYIKISTLMKEYFPEFEGDSETSFIYGDPMIYKPGKYKICHFSIENNKIGRAPTRNKRSPVSFPHSQKEAILSLSIKKGIEMGLPRNTLGALKTKIRKNISLNTNVRSTQIIIKYLEERGL